MRITLDYNRNVIQLEGLVKADILMNIMESVGSGWIIVPANDDLLECDEVKKDDDGNYDFGGITCAYPKEDIGSMLKDQSEDVTQIQDRAMPCNEAPYDSNIQGVQDIRGTHPNPYPTNIYGENPLSNFFTKIDAPQSLIEEIIRKWNINNKS